MHWWVLFVLLLLVLFVFVVLLVIGWFMSLILADRISKKYTQTQTTQSQRLDDGAVMCACCVVCCVLCVVCCVLCVVLMVVMNECDCLTKPVTLQSRSFTLHLLTSTQLSSCVPFFISLPTRLIST